MNRAAAASTSTRGRAEIVADAARTRTVPDRSNRPGNIMHAMAKAQQGSAPPTGSAGISASAVRGSEFGEVAARLTRERHAGLDDQAVALGLTIIRVSNAHMQESERRIHRPHGWSWSGFHLMYMIWLFGEIEARDIARLAGVTRQTASSVLSNLESNGFVQRERTSSTDRRLVSVTLTPKGLEAIDEAFTEQNELETEWFGCLSPEERDLLKNLLDRVATQIKHSKHAAP
ncbi:MarR family winged helix-turn-helix transcriptional regulator [Rhodococcus sp. NPDC057014]|uniref:MarR family winged helix-turn-helix transcriptional regulator n=1 Tax=unclassified Rhodococcus (in: high G+C Gram-positive bacteria) TaxID=192944 RepID=UPI00363B3681